jgi:hypothetical protein
MGRGLTTDDVASWGDLYPRRCCAWEEREGGVTLLRPRFGRGRLGRHLERLFGSRPFRLHLEEVGSFVWRRCDGATRVADIAHALSDEFGDKVAPVEERLVLFLRQLVRGRYARVGPAPAEGGEPAGE